jgi:hypothetical protein
MEGIGVGEKAKLPSPLLGENDLRNLLIFNKDIAPDGDKLIEGEREADSFFYGLEKFSGRNFARVETIDDPFLKVEEIRK